MAPPVAPAAAGTTTTWPAGAGGGAFGHHEFFRAAMPADLDRQHYRLRLIWAAGSSASPAAHRAWVNMACPFHWHGAASAAVQTPSHGPLVRRGLALPLQDC